MILDLTLKQKLTSKRYVKEKIFVNPYLFGKLLDILEFY